MFGNRRALVVAAVQLSRRFPALQPGAIASLLVTPEDAAPLGTISLHGVPTMVWGIPDAGHYTKFVEHLATALSCSHASGYIKALQLEGTEEAEALRQVAEANAVDYQPAANALLELFESCKTASPPSAPSTNPAG